MIADFIQQADSYVEISQSGKGLHIFLELTEPFNLITNRKEPFEVYCVGRYIAVTENCYGEPKEVRKVTRRSFRVFSLSSTIPGAGKKRPCNQQILQSLLLVTTSCSKKCFHRRTVQRFNHSIGATLPSMATTTPGLTWPSALIYVSGQLRMRLA